MCFYSSDVGILNKRSFIESQQNIMSRSCFCYSTGQVVSLAGFWWSCQASRETMPPPPIRAARSLCDLLTSKAWVGPASYSWSHRAGFPLGGMPLEACQTFPYSVDTQKRFPQRCSHVSLTSSKRQRQQQQVHTCSRPRPGGARIISTLLEW